MQSMTGYGSCLATEDGRELFLELKTVNHRFLDISFRIPKPVAFLEDSLRRLLAGSGLLRGHVDVFATYQNRREDARHIQLDMPLFRACAEACNQAAAAMPEAKKMSPAEMLGLCGALTVTQGEEDREAVIRLAQEAFAGAAEQLLEMRHREGNALEKDLREHLQRLEELICAIKQRAPEVPAAYRERLDVRLGEWDVQVADPGRMMQEIALLADRCAVDEEISRLESHCAQFLEGLSGNEETGRRLEFLLQEMNREVNTIGSKASDGEIAARVVDAKCELEKLREQVQNVV